MYKTYKNVYKTRNKHIYIYIYITYKDIYKAYKKHI